MSIVFFTDCQGSLIYENYLRNTFFFKHGSYKSIRYFNIHNIDTKSIKECDLFIYEPVNKYTIKTNDSLLNLLKPSCIKICIPSCFIDMWPLYEEGRGFYGGEIVNKYKNLGYELDEIINMYDTGKLCFDLENRFHMSLKCMKLTEDNYCDIKISDFILKNYKKYRLFDTQNHPNGIIISYIAKEICRILNVDFFPDIDIFSQENIHVMSLSWYDSIYMKKELDLQYIGDDINDDSKNHYRDLIVKIFNNTSLIKYKYKQQKQFITFGAGGQNWYDAGNRIINQAKNVNIFDKIKLYTDKDLKKDNIFWQKHGTFIENNTRGYGYMLWKPYIIKQTMGDMNDGDMLLYLDCGCEINVLQRQDILNHFEYLKNDYIIGTSVPATIGLERHYNKMDLLLHMDMLYDKYLNTLQRQSGVLMFLVCDKTRNIVNEWYNIGCNYHLIDDSESIHTNLESNREHRHDQSIFSLLTKKYNVFSNHSLFNCIHVWRKRSGDSDFQVYKLNGQAEQDKFVLNVLKQKTKGFFLEIGSGHHVEINNTYILENHFKWKGIMIDQSSEWLADYKIHRQNSIHVINDATKIDYVDLFKTNNVPLNIDYLQIDLDSMNGSTLQTLEKLDNEVMDTYKFAVVTFNHDYKAGLSHLPMVQMTRTKSREIFKKRGYIRVFEDIHNIHPDSVFEDWYVHPELLDIGYISTLKEKNANKYIANSITGKSINWQDIEY